MYAIGFALSAAASDADPYFVSKGVALHGLALGCFASVVGDSRPFHNKVSSPVASNLTVHIPFWGISLLAIVAVVGALTGDFSSKREILDAGNPTLPLITLATVSVILAVLYVMKNGFFTTGSVVMVATSIILALAGLLILGERDILLTFTFMIGLTYLTLFNKGNGWYLVAIVITGLIFVPFLSGFKAAALGNFQDMTFKSLLMGRPTGEFEAAGRNLYYIQQAGYGGYFGGETLIWDFKRIFSSSLAGISWHLSPTGWFNQEFRPSHGIGGSSGWGFSMVAEGFINFGIAGVIGFYSFIGLMTRSLYNYSVKNVYLQTLYFFFLTVLIYTTRADLANLLSLTIKVGMVPLILVWVFHQVLNDSGKQLAVVKPDNLPYEMGDYR